MQPNNIIKSFKNIPAGTYMSMTFLIIGFVSMACFSGCTKFVQVGAPTTAIAGSSVYANNTSAAAVMSGLYSNMIQGSTPSGRYSVSFLCGLSADELTNYYSSDKLLSQAYTNSFSSLTTIPEWLEIYDEIYVSNAVIDGLSGSSGVTPAMKQQLTGEALFMRAFLHFYAVNLFGDVPLVTTTNYLTNGSIQKSPQALVYQQIISDLKTAKSDLSDDFVDANGNVTTDRTRPNKGAATALLARAYLYTQAYDSAETEATEVIGNTNYQLLPDLTQVFLANSSEAIWQFFPVNTAYNTLDGYYFILTSAPGSFHYSVSLSQTLVNAFEPGDLRYTNWVDSLVSNGTTYYYPYKYKVGQRYQPQTEYLVALRFAEQYLIRAEARAQRKNISGAQQDLNMIRSRAGLPANTDSVQTTLLADILHERQTELFTEWGHRWSDLKRTGSINSVMGSPGNVCAQKGGSWDPNWALFPIPQSTIKIDPNLVQNPGYN